GGPLLARDRPAARLPVDARRYPRRDASAEDRAGDRDRSGRGFGRRSRLTETRAARRSRRGLSGRLADQTLELLAHQIRIDHRFREIVVTADRQRILLLGGPRLSREGDDG